MQNYASARDEAARAKVPPPFARAQVRGMCDFSYGSEAPVAARTELSVEFAPVDHTGRMHPVDEGQCRFRPGAPSLCFLLLRKVIDGNVTTAMQRALMGDFRPNATETAWTAPEYRCC